MVTAVLFLCIIPVRADAASWVKNPDGSYSCYEDGKLLKSQRVGNYYVDSSGRMVTNRWVKRRFYGDDGKYIKQFKGGWQQIQGNWYYYSASGQKRIGWLTNNGRRSIILMRTAYFRRAGRRSMELLTISIPERATCSPVCGRFVESITISAIQASRFSAG